MAGIDTLISKSFSVALKNKIEVVGKCFSGKEAVELYKKSNPDWVFLDIMMPDGNGVYALRKIREINPAAKVIAVTADARSITEEKLKKLNVNGIVYKPFDMEKILALIQK